MKQLFHSRLLDMYIQSGQTANIYRKSVFYALFFATLPLCH